MILIKSSKDSTIAPLGGIMTIMEVSIRKSQDQKNTVAAPESLKRKLTATQKRRALKRKSKAS